MAQDFENAIARAQGTTAAAILTSNSDDAIIGIRVANIVSTTIAVDIYIVRSSANYYICKGLSIPPNSSVELIQGGAKIVLISKNSNCSILHQTQILPSHPSKLSFSISAAFLSTGTLATSIAN